MSITVPPQISLEEIETLPALSSESREYIQRLCSYNPPQFDLSVSRIEIRSIYRARTARLISPEHAINRRAAVLILLFEREGSLRVLLTTRSKNLRSHPGQTALPGGKHDETDESLVATAYREAFEEIGLDTTSPHLRTVVTLPPFLSSKKLIVTPIVGLLTDPSVISTLVPCQDEVDLIFDHPVKAFLDPSVIVGENLVPIGSEQWKWPSELHDFQDFPGLIGHTYRMHRFRSTGSPITGLTADIMIFVAEVGYNAATTFDRWASDQPTALESVLLVLRDEAKMYWEQQKST